MNVSALAQAVIRELQRRDDPSTKSAAWRGIQAAICADPRPFASALGLIETVPRNGPPDHFADAQEG
jgi:hypothetical protein